MVLATGCAGCSSPALHSPPSWPPRFPNSLPSITCLEVSADMFPWCLTRCKHRSWLSFIVLSFVHEDHELDFYPFVGNERVPEDSVIPPSEAFWSTRKACSPRLGSPRLTVGLVGTNPGFSLLDFPLITVVFTVKR